MPYTEKGIYAIISLLKAVATSTNTVSHRAPVINSGVSANRENPAGKAYTKNRLIGFLR